MTTLRIRAGALPQFAPLTALARVSAVLWAAVDIFAEATQSARDAQKRYPFVSFE